MKLSDVREMSYKNIYELKNCVFDGSDLTVEQKRSMIKLLFSKSVEISDASFENFEDCGFESVDDLFFNIFEISEITINEINELSDLFGVDKKQVLKILGDKVELIFFNLNDIDREFIEYCLEKRKYQICMSDDKDCLDVVIDILSDKITKEDKDDWIRKNHDYFANEIFRDGKIVLNEFTCTNDLLEKDIANLKFQYIHRNRSKTGRVRRRSFSDETIGPLDFEIDSEDLELLKKLRDTKGIEVFVKDYINTNILGVSDHYFEKKSEWEEYFGENFKIELDGIEPVDLEKFRKEQGKVNLEELPNITFLVKIKDKKDLEDLESLESCSLIVEIENASKLSVEDIEKLKADGKKIEKIVIRRDEITKDSGYLDYDVETYCKCKRELDKLVEGLDAKNDSQVKILLTILDRFLSNTNYNHRAADGTIVERQKLRYVSRNLEGGLLDKECVCAGFAEIVRNALAMVGIESNYIVSEPDKKYTKKDETITHAFLQVKIGEDWFYCDPTWMLSDFKKRDLSKIKSQLLCTAKEFEIKEKFHTPSKLYTVHETKKSGKELYGNQINQFFNTEADKEKMWKEAFGTGNIEKIVDLLKCMNLVDECAKAIDGILSEDDLMEIQNEVMYCSINEEYSADSYDENYMKMFTLDSMLMDKNLIESRSRLGSYALSNTPLKNIINSNETVISELIFDGFENVDSFVYSFYDLERELFVYDDLKKFCSVLDISIEDLIRSRENNIIMYIPKIMSKDSIMEFINSPEIFDYLNQIQVEDSGEEELTLFDKCVFEKMGDFKGQTKERKKFYEKIKKLYPDFKEVENANFIVSDILPLEYDIAQIDMRDVKKGQDMLLENNIVLD